MKMKLFFRISVLALCILMSLSSFADDKKDRISVEEIDWSANNESLETIVSTSAAPNKIYLYTTKNKKFVTVGGRYGAQPILAEVGMYFYVEKVAANDDRYYIHSWVNNPTTSQGTGNADYLGVEPLMDTDQRIFLTDPKKESMKSIYLYVDRGINNTHDDGTYSSPERIKWHIKSVDTNNGYQIYSTWSDNQKYSDNAVRDYYLSYYADPNSQKKFLVVTTDKSQAETFYFIKKEDYRKVINSQNKKYINVSGLVRDARFERNNKGIDGTFDLKGDYNTESKNNVWQFRYDRNYDTYVFPNKQDNVEDLAYMTAWVGCEGSSENQKGNYLIQKITKLKPGLYRVNCQGFYFNPNDKNDKDNTSFVFASQDYTDISNQTALKTIESADWDSMQNMTYHGSPKTADGKNGYVDYSIKHCVNAGKIFAESNPYEDKDVDHRKYDNSVAVLVKADAGLTTGTLYIGAGKRANEGGYAFFDNFQLFYMGDRQWYLDATNTSTEDFTTTKSTDDYDTPSGINRNPEGPDQYKFPVTYNIRRYFHVGKWESLILPCTLTGDQVKQTFGGDQEVKLSVFDRVDGTCVYFRPVDLDKDSIVAGTPYIIKVGKGADIESKKEYTFPWGNSTTVKVKGPIYQVKGVVPPTFKGKGVTIEDKTSNVLFHGFYYDPGEAPAGAYVVNNDNMYHLTSAWNSFVGTSWYITITDAQGNAKALSFSFDGDSSTTAIENVTRQEDAAVQTDGFVYNLSGQRVGTRNNMSNLSSGIYIVAGKKVVVK
ncbi:uncharacterized protein BN731_00905 [Prevotella sp. CAG:604]|nr:uncharacterized protein BN731_00905 [Prevotella sp. CAG:604]